MPRFRTLLLTIALAAAVLALLGCASTIESESVPGATTSPVGTWSLTKIEDERYDLPTGARTPTLTITEQGGLSGQAGVNRYSGSTDAGALSSGEWSLGSVAMTRMGGTPEAMQLEQQFVGLMKMADTIATGPDWLELRIGNSSLLRFTHVEQ